MWKKALVIPCKIPRVETGNVYVVFGECLGGILGNSILSHARRLEEMF